MGRMLRHRFRAGRSFPISFHDVFACTAAGVFSVLGWRGSFAWCVIHSRNSLSLLNNSLSASETTYAGRRSINSAYLRSLWLIISSTRTCIVALLICFGGAFKTGIYFSSSCGSVLHLFSERSISICGPNLIGPNTVGWAKAKLSRRRDAGVLHRPNLASAQGRE